MTEPHANGETAVRWERGVVEPCVLCDTPVHVGLDGWGVDHPMMETYAHTICPNEAIQAKVRDLRQRLYLSESVCWALYRREAVGSASVDEDGDEAHLRTRWADWKATIEAGAGANTERSS